MTDEFIEFPMSNDKAAQDRAYWYRQGKDDGIEQERGNIVEWLRREDDRLTNGGALTDADYLASAIEAGEHLK